MTTSVSSTLEMHQDCVNTLVKYACKTPSALPVLASTIAVQWYRRTAEQWHAQPWMRPVVPQVPESFTMSINVAPYVANNFKSWCYEMGMDPAGVMTVLARRYIAQNNIKWWAGKLKDNQADPDRWRIRS